MAGNDPSETARWLAACVKSIDGAARSSLGDDTKLATHLVAVAKEFLAAFQSSLGGVVPILRHTRRSAPVQHAGVSGASYHEVVCRIALAQYEAIWCRQSPEAYFSRLEQPKESEFELLTGREVSIEGIAADWREVADDIARRFSDVEPIDAYWLIAGIDSDPSPKPPPPRERLIVHRSHKGDVIELDGTKYPVSVSWADAFEAMLAANGAGVGLTSIVGKTTRAIEKLPPELQGILTPLNGNKGYVLQLK